MKTISKEAEGSDMSIKESQKFLLFLFHVKLVGPLKKRPPNVRASAGSFNKARRACKLQIGTNLQVVILTRESLSKMVTNK